MTYDVVIAGGGPAGSSCARRAAQHGLDVLLLDKVTHPRRKACGGGFRAGLPDLLDFDIAPAIDRIACGSHVFSPSRTKVICTKDQVTGYTVKRRVFDNHLLEKAAEAGAELVIGVKVIEVSESGSDVAVFGDDGKTYRASYLVGADGVNSRVARASGIKKRWKDDEIGLCIEARVPMDDDDILRITHGPYESDRICIQIYFGGLEHGYAWCFPKKGEISLGMGCLMPFAGDLRHAWSVFTQEFEERYDIRLDLSEETAMRVPLKGPIGNTVTNRIMLVGDAAGFVSPATGEGIPYAVETGQIAADTVHDIMTGRADGPREYQRRWKKGIGKQLGVATFLGNLLFNSQDNMERIVQMAADDEVIRRHLTDLIGGLRPYSDLRMAIMKRVITHHTLTGLRMLF